MTTNPQRAALFAALMAASTSAAMAQETDSTDPSLGEVVVDERPLGTEYVKELHGDWAVRCLTTDQDKDPCSLYQLLLDEAGNSVAEITLFPLQQSQNGAVVAATFIAPLETFLPVGVTLGVDGGEARRYPFEFCTQIGCFSRMGFTDVEVDAFRRGAVANVRIVPAGARDRTVDLQISLTGFTAGLQSLIDAL